MSYFKNIQNYVYTSYESAIRMAIKKSLDTYQNELDNNLQISLTTEPVTTNEKLFQETHKKLNDFQKKIFTECVGKKSGGLSLPLGSGKTLISLVLSLYFTRQKGTTLIVVSKSLVINWEHEINKFFGDSLKYEVINQSATKLANWKLRPDTSIVITTIDVLSRSYKVLGMKELFVDQIFTAKENIYINHYKCPNKPFLNHVIGSGVFYSIEWGCLIVDEIQKYTNIETKWCQSLSAICSSYRWGLSGTMFDEPKIKCILGYYMIINDKKKPRNIPDMNELLHNKLKFKGLNESLVARESNKAFKPPIVNEYIIKHKLDPEEETVYLTMKKILVQVQRRASMAKLYENNEELRKFNSYKMVMVAYLRQALTCPLIPITSVVIDACDMRKRSELSQIILDEINKVGLEDWTNKEKSVKSSRIKKTLECIKKHPDERIIIFACFKSYIDILQYYVSPIDRPCFRMKASMNADARGDLLKRFEKSDNGILLISYQLGAEGLNLQFASTIFITDFWWNASKVQQAIGRIFRFGQVSDEINVYFFTANTGIEKILFEKQKAKLDVISELKTGAIKTKIPTLSLDRIIQIIELSDNEKKLKDIKFY